MRKILLSVLLLFSLCLAGGCAVPGGGSTAGTSAGDGKGVSDAGITSAIKEAFKQDELLSSADIDVTTEQGVVTLSGSVPSAPAYNRAISLARRVPGVKPPVQVGNLMYPGR